MSTADVLLRIRFLLSQRLEHTATRADNIKLSSTLNDLVNLMPANTELFMVWQALSSSKKDMARFEDNITRLVAFLQSASIANIAPAVASAAAFYNSGLKRATSESGQDATIVTKVIIPPSPPANSPPPPRQVQMGANTPGPVMTAEPIASPNTYAQPAYTARGESLYQLPPPGNPPTPLTDFTVQAGYPSSNPSEGFVSGLGDFNVQSSFSPPSRNTQQHDVDRDDSEGFVDIPPGYSLLPEIQRAGTPIPTPAPQQGREQRQTEWAQGGEAGNGYAAEMGQASPHPPSAPFSSPPPPPPVFQPPQQPQQQVQHTPMSPPSAPATLGNQNQNSQYNGVDPNRTLSPAIQTQMYAPPPGPSPSAKVDPGVSAYGKPYQPTSPPPTSPAAYQNQDTKYSNVQSQSQQTYMPPPGPSYRRSPPTSPPQGGANFGGGDGAIRSPPPTSPAAYQNQNPKSSNVQGQSQQTYTPPPGPSYKQSPPTSPPQGGANFVGGDGGIQSPNQTNWQPDLRQQQLNASEKTVASGGNVSYDKPSSPPMNTIPNASTSPRQESMSPPVQMMNSLSLSETYPQSPAANVGPPAPQQYQNQAHQQQGPAAPDRPHPHHSASAPVVSQVPHYAPSNAPSPPLDRSAVSNTSPPRSTTRSTFAPGMTPRYSTLPQFAPNAPKPVLQQVTGSRNPTSAPTTPAAGFSGASGYAATLPPTPSSAPAQHTTLASFAQPPQHPHHANTAPVSASAASPGFGQTSDRGLTSTGGGGLLGSLGKLGQQAMGIGAVQGLLGTGPGGANYRPPQQAPHARQSYQPTQPPGPPPLQQQGYPQQQQFSPPPSTPFQQPQQSFQPPPPQQLYQAPPPQTAYQPTQPPQQAFQAPPGAPTSGQPPPNFAPPPGPGPGQQQQPSGFPNQLGYPRPQGAAPLAGYARPPGAPTFQGPPGQPGRAPGQQMRPMGQQVRPVGQPGRPQGQQMQPAGQYGQPGQQRPAAAQHSGFGLGALAAGLGGMGALGAALNTVSHMTGASTARQSGSHATGQHHAQAGAGGALGTAFKLFQKYEHSHQHHGGGHHHAAAGGLFGGAAGGGGDGGDPTGGAGDPSNSGLFGFGGGGDGDGDGDYSNSGGVDFGGDTDQSSGGGLFGFGSSNDDSGGGGFMDAFSGGSDDGGGFFSNDDSGSGFGGFFSN